MHMDLQTLVFYSLLSLKKIVEKHFLLFLGTTINSEEREQIASPFSPTDWLLF